MVKARRFHVNHYPFPKRETSHSGQASLSLIWVLVTHSSSLCSVDYILLIRWSPG